MVRDARTDSDSRRKTISRYRSKAKLIGGPSRGGRDSRCKSVGARYSTVALVGRPRLESTGGDRAANHTAK